ncbi:hypothetical protein DSM03_11616 [Leeuwenhoekiella aestuarii]|uniref:tail fiber protein n=1 Tax=Leeuwenhoekiella aestuarii TaxID=2249426 RepID=UPI000FFF17A1|nr:tail fiber protein [Leeuwenhoekiella aestuarii]RXG11485.1 hypothetical protein DSM03_11616 [Leeuwenhoekiella aestuarii]
MQGVNNNIDELWLSRFNESNNISQLRVNIGDDSSNQFLDQFVIGVTQSSTWNPQFTVFSDGKVGIGTSSPDEALTVKGKIHTQEVRVDLDGAVAPDYVFKNDYKLLDLKEVKRFIHKEGHLPNIPSASEMNKDGLNLKEMNLK